jgi:TonB family protein
MKNRFAISGLLLTIVLSSFSVHGQARVTEMKSFEKDGLSFNYPSAWTLTDKSDAQKQYLALTHGDSSILIVILAYRDQLSTAEQLETARRNITEPYIDSLANNLSTPGHPAKRDTTCTDLGGPLVQGVELRGLYHDQPTTAEVYALARGGRFLNVVYLGAAKDWAEGSAAWGAIRKTLKTSSPNTGSGFEALENANVNESVLRGKAVEMPRPDYPVAARREHAAGTVAVQITVDEEGNVISAKAMRGHPFLRGAAEEAARRAKFTPTLLCGRPMKVTGVIVYNFVLPVGRMP